MTEIVQFYDQQIGFDLLHRRGDDYSVRNRINAFRGWCNHWQINWMQADLADYRDALLEDLAPSSVEAHLSTLRQRIRDVVEDNKFLDTLRQALWQEGDGPAEMYAKTEIVVQRLQNMANPRRSSVSVVKNQELADSQRVWLNGGPDQELLAKIGQGKAELHRLRDEAIGFLLLYTGLRSQELCDLLVGDLYETYQGYPALRVRAGKGNKQRMIVYGDLTEGLERTELWLKSAKIFDYDQPVFQGFWTGYTALRGRKLIRKTIHSIIAAVELSIGYVSPHDLRRTYARMCYLPPFNMKIEQIQKQMGHSSRVVTEEYIGEANIEERVPRKS